MLNVSLRGRGWRASSSLFLYYACPVTRELLVPQKTFLKNKSLSPYCNEKLRWILAPFAPTDHKIHITACCFYLVVFLTTECICLRCRSWQETGAIVRKLHTQDRTSTKWTQICANAIQITFKTCYGYSVDNLWLTLVDWRLPVKLWTQIFSHVQCLYY